MTRKEALEIAEDVKHDSNNELALKVVDSIFNGSLERGHALCEVVMIRGEKTDKISKKLLNYFVSLLQKYRCSQSNDEFYKFLMMIQDEGLRNAFKKVPIKILEIDMKECQNKLEFEVQYGKYFHLVN